MTQVKIDKSIDGMLGPRTRGDTMEGTDESTELYVRVFVEGMAS